DRLVELQPEAEPELWQRGLALYYAGRFADGRRQFELHRTVNPADVENVAWHFACVARDQGPDKARQAIIPVGQDRRVPMREILDLFAGTGAYGLEALSRGASSAIFVEQEFRTAAALRQNISSLQYDSPVIESSVEAWLPRATPASFDLIFLDPPYDRTGAELSLWPVVQGLHLLLRPNGRVIWEHSCSSKWSPLAPIETVWHREYGRSSVSFLAHPVVR
ncbi:MAG: hypothetical protein EBY83_08090, partial [Verrucomicrobia bacterium]|nr:hypothetical protein [Verrucomicrobiota bacterium]